jgi:hypothetical protein
MRLTGTITRVVEQRSVDDFALASCTVEYAVDGHRYQISAELEPEGCTLGRTIELMALPSMPSDAVLLRTCGRPRIASRPSPSASAQRSSPGATSKHCSSSRGGGHFTP